jgi:diguanylate cyclase (GGDEF)-like protein
MIITAVLVAVGILTSNILLFSRFVDTNLNEELRKTLAMMHNEIEMTESKSYIASLYFAIDPAVVRAMENGNREALLSRITALKEDTGVELCAVTDISGKVLARTHNPQMYGDDISDMHSILSALLGSPFSTIEYSMYEEMIACSAAPVYDEEGHLLGAVAVGFRLYSNEFVDRQKSVANCEISVFRGDLCVGTTLRNSDGTRAIHDTAPENISRTVLAGKTYSTRTGIFSRNMLTIYMPVKTSDGGVVGMLSAGYLSTEKTRAVLAFITAGFIITMSFLGISVLIIVFLVGYVSSPITKMLDNVNYDALTGIFSRRYFDENLIRLMKILSRSSSTLSLMMIDIDFFKNYNDTYGHNEGDKCLKAVAKALTDGITRSDDFVARYGGEEFVVVLPNTEEIGARLIANKLLENVRNRNIPHTNSAAADHVTVSIGVTTGNVGSMQIGEEYVKRADEMLYKSKNNGRNRYNFESL